MHLFSQTAAAEQQCYYSSTSCCSGKHCLSRQESGVSTCCYTPSKPWCTGMPRFVVVVYILGYIFSCSIHRVTAVHAVESCYKFLESKYCVPSCSCMKASSLVPTAFFGEAQRAALGSVNSQHTSPNPNPAFTHLASCQESETLGKGALKLWKGVVVFGAH